MSSPTDYRDWVPARGAKPTLRKFISQHGVIDGFQHARQERGVDAKGSIDDLPGDGVPGHKGF